MGLNPPQREAVLYDAGPLLILAGAGSGKTKTLTHRIAYLVAARGVAPSQIMAVTFTNKAAKEMKERLDRLMGNPDASDFRSSNYQQSINISGGGKGKEQDDLVSPIVR